MTARVQGYVSRTIARWDGVVLAIAALMAILAIALPAQAGESALFTLKNYWHVVPFLLLSVAAAAYAQASGADNLIAKAFQGNVSRAIVMGALVGAFSPFCSCGVIPLVAALLSVGVPLPAVMAFWLSSPLMDPSMFALTMGTLGPHFAAGKTVATVGIGLLGGFGTLPLMHLYAFANPLQDGAGNGGCGGSKVRNPKAVEWKFWQAPERNQKFRQGALKNWFFLSKWLVLAFLLESLMLAYVPNEMVSAIAGDGNVFSVIGAAIVGVPAYLNGYAALPLIQGLTEQGMSLGAGMSFLLAGGATSLPAALAVYAIARKPVFAAYLGFAFIGAVLSGVLYGLVA
ncbi:MAG: permease [Cyanobacteria bacterium J06639_1]